jgi:hypothetical protein
LGLNLDWAPLTEEFPGEEIEFEIVETQLSPFTGTHPQIPYFL